MKNIFLRGFAGFACVVRNLTTVKCHRLPRAEDPHGAGPALSTTPSMEWWSQEISHELMIQSSRSVVNQNIVMLPIFRSYSRYQLRTC